MKKILGEFKKFITRGNIVDMSVGVIVGSSFTAIVNALSNNILKPIINWILTLVFGKDSLSEVFTFLKRVTLEDGSVDLTQSIYIDWGAFINAVINFFIVAAVLFTIVKLINAVRDGQKKALSDLPTKADRKEMKKQKINQLDPKAVEAFMNAKREAAAKKAEEEKAAAEEAARQERLENPTTEDLLKQILELMRAEK